MSINVGKEVAALQRMAVNDDEAARVRTIFDLYLEHQSLMAVNCLKNPSVGRFDSWVKHFPDVCDRTFFLRSL